MNVEQIARRLSSGAKAALLRGVGCNNHHELMNAGLWEREFANQDVYFVETETGIAVRDYLRSQAND